MAESPDEYLKRANIVEDDAWEAMRKVILAAAAGGLAISFLVLGVDGGRQLEQLPWAWWLLVAGLILGALSYGVKVAYLRRVVTSFARLFSADEPVPPLKSGIFVRATGELLLGEVVEHIFLVVAGMLTLAAFVVLVLSGLSLREFAEPTPALVP